MRVEIEDLIAVTRDLINKASLYQFFPAKTEIARSNLLNDLTKFEMMLEEMLEKRK